MVMPADSALMLSALQDAVQPPPYGSDINDMGKAHGGQGAARQAPADPTHAWAAVRGRADARFSSCKAQLAVRGSGDEGLHDAPLHGKTYIFHAPGNADRRASRLRRLVEPHRTPASSRTSSSTSTSPTTTPPTKLANWFTDRWDDPFSLTITAEIIELIEESWAAETQPTPYEVYLKVCHALSEDAREGMGYVLPPSMQNLLLDYQETAVRTLARRIVRRGGTMLGDVVGLGKTLTAVATALMLEAAEDYTTLVLCPKNLEHMWEEHLERYGLDRRPRRSRTRWPTRSCPNSSASTSSSATSRTTCATTRTKASEAIQDYVRRNGSKVLLLTATPYNLAFADVANQIGLYIDDDEDLGIQPTAAMAKDPTLIDKVDGKITTLAAFRRSEEPEDWKRLMSDHLVRRTRSFIKRTAKKETVTLPDGKIEEREYLQFANGQRFHFPTRVAKPAEPRVRRRRPGAADGGRRHPRRDPRPHLAALPPRRLRRPEGAAHATRTPRSSPTSAPVAATSAGSSGSACSSGCRRQGTRSSSASSASEPATSSSSTRSTTASTCRSAASATTSSWSPTRTSKTRHDGYGSLESQYNELQRRLPASTKWLSTHGLQDDAAQGPRARQPDHHRAARQLRRLGPGQGLQGQRPGRPAARRARGRQGAGLHRVRRHRRVRRRGTQGRRHRRTSDSPPATPTIPPRIARRFSPDSNRLPGEDGRRDAESTIRSTSSSPPTCCPRARTSRTPTSS